MPDSAREQLLHCCHKRKYAPKSVIITEGDIGKTLYYILEGSVEVSMLDEMAEHEIVLAYLNKGDFIGEMHVFMEPAPLDVTVVTREACVLAEISYDRLNQLLRGQLAEFAFDILQAMGSQLASRLLRTSRKVGSLAFMDVAGRIANALNELCQQPEAMTHPQGTQIHVTRQQLGRIVGCSRELAGKVLKDMEDQQLIQTSGKTIVVLNSPHQSGHPGPRILHHYR